MRARLRGVAPRELVGESDVLDAGTAYRRGYLERPDRRERFPRNQDMEALHALGPADSLAFIKNFFARHEGKYDVAPAETPEPAEAVHTGA